MIIIVENLLKVWQKLLQWDIENINIILIKHLQKNQISALDNP